MPKSREKQQGNKQSEEVKRRNTKHKKQNTNKERSRVTDKIKQAKSNVY